MTKLNINIDHVATLRQARLGFDPDPISGLVGFLVNWAPMILLIFIIKSFN